MQVDADGSVEDVSPSFNRKSQRLSENALNLSNSDKKLRKNLFDDKLLSNHNNSIASKNLKKNLNGGTLSKKVVTSATQDIGSKVVDSQATCADQRDAGSNDSSYSSSGLSNNSRNSKMSKKS